MLRDMIMGFVSTMLGPSGMKILDWYVENNLYVNGVIVLIALLYIVFPKQGKKITGRIRELYLRSPFAPDEKDRLLIEERRSRMGKFTNKRQK